MDSQRGAERLSADTESVARGALRLGRQVVNPDRSVDDLCDRGRVGPLGSP